MYQRNMFSEIEIAIKYNTKITYSVWWCDALTKDVCRESGCTYNDEISFVGIDPKFIVCHPVRVSLRPRCLREISVSAVDKEMYIWE